MGFENENIALKEVNALIRNFENSIVFKDEPELNNQLLTLIDRPFINDDRNSDVLSMLYHRFFVNSDIPIALPVFAYLSILSAWCVKNNVVIREPLEIVDKPMDTWVMLLAPSGVAKTTSMSWIKNIIPTIDGQMAIEPNFQKGNGPLAFFESLQALEDGKGFWVQDEASQLISLVEQEGHPMAEIKDYLLKMKDHAVVTRKKGGAVMMETDPIVMTTLFINTIDSMAKKISDESFKDGLTRRYTIGMALKDDRDFSLFANYDVSKICDDNLKVKILDIFLQDLQNKQFTYNPKAVIVYEKMFHIFWHKQYKKFMTGQETTYRTYFREAYKYSVLHHIIHKQEGTEIDNVSMEWGLKVVLYFLNSLQEFIKYRANDKSNITTKASIITKAVDFINESENKVGFGMRAFCRKFTLKKEDAIELLESIKAHNPKLKSQLFAEVKKYNEKNKRYKIGE